MKIPHSFAAWMMTPRVLAGAAPVDLLKDPPESLFPALENFSQERWREPIRKDRTELSKQAWWSTTRSGVVGVKQPRWASGCVAALSEVAGKPR